MRGARQRRAARRAHPRAGRRRQILGFAGSLADEQGRTSYASRLVAVGTKDVMRRRERLGKDLVQFVGAHALPVPDPSSDRDAPLPICGPDGIRHVAIIMDGNGRWAQARGLIRIRGHEHGVESVRSATRHAARLGLEQLTLYAFSTENWKRPKAEIDFLMRLLRRYLIDERDELMENDIRLTAIGDIDGLPRHVQRALARTRELTAENQGMVLCLALNYGGRAEIAEAARRLAEDVAAGRLDPAELAGEGAERALGERLYQPEMPPLDLLIRTAGEQRLSNFLLWQMSYAEFYAAEVKWPEFREPHLEQALRNYATRTRRFGGLVRKG